MHKITIFAVSKVPCISFVGLENSIFEKYVTMESLKCYSKRLSWGALFMMLGSVKVHGSNVFPKIGYCT